MSRKQWILLAAKAVITVVCMTVLVRAIRFDEIAQALRNPHRPAFLVLAAVLVLPNFFLQWLRWHRLLRLIDPAVRVSESVVSLAGGMVAGFVTPGRIGEVGRTLFLKRETRLEAIGLLLLDKWYAFTPVVAAGIWGITLMILYLFHYAAFLVWPLGCVALFISGLVVLISLSPSTIRTFLYNLSMIMPARDKIKRIISSVDRFDAKQARMLFILSILLYGTYILQFCLLAFAFEPLPWTTALTATTSTMFVKTLLPISIGDLGIREGASVYFFLKFNVSKVTAFNSSLLLFVLNVLVPTLASLLVMPKMTWPESEKSAAEK
jgi:uncharacterized protein (TIRG00374 family)